MMTRRYGYKMFDCSLTEWNEHLSKKYSMKKDINPDTIFSYTKFETTESARDKINFIFIPTEHGLLPRTKWSLSGDKTLLIKEIAFTNNNDSILYQNSVERGWALGGHLDPRVVVIYYE